ncbi:hypothetical protein C8Q80DRAFT_1289214 [Daedaleopsis nitida]|nr:hypothetical protein C8Q80DRAFT_1289214 [Daedaleopsis nitida]
MSTSTSSAHASSTRTRRRRSPEFKFVRQGKSVSRAWALEIDQDCLDRWGNILYDKLCPGTRATKSPEEVRKTIRSWGLLPAHHMAYESYCKFSNLPRFERNVFVLPHSGTPRRMTWLFVLKDNSSREALDAPVTPEDVEAVKAFLGVKEQDAKWFEVSHRLNDCLDRWGNTLYDKLCPDTRATKSPEEVRKTIRSWGLLPAHHLAYESYCKFPNLPRFERNVFVLPHSGTPRRMTWLFVLKDNSSHDALNAPVKPEDVEALKAFLGVKEQDPKWYDVSGRLNASHARKFPQVIGADIISVMLGSRADPDRVQRTAAFKDPIAPPSTSRSQNATNQKTEPKHGDLTTRARHVSHTSKNRIISLSLTNSLWDSVAFRRQNNSADMTLGVPFLRNT